MTEELLVLKATHVLLERALILVKEGADTLLDEEQLPTVRADIIRYRQALAGAMMQMARASKELEIAERDALAREDGSLKPEGQGSGMP